MLKELNNWKPVAAFRTSWIEETNLPALQAFLIAEQFYRRSAWDSAMAYYARAIDADSAFALANRHAGLVVGWRRSNTDSISRAFLRTAGRYNRGLPRRDSLLVVADSVRSTLALFETDTAYFASIRRLVSTLETARDSFPDDPEVWYALGDAYFHYSSGAQLSVAEDTILAAFDRFDSTRFRFHAGLYPRDRAGADSRRKRGGASIRRSLSGARAGGPRADGVRVLTLLLRDGRISSRAAKILDTLSEDSFETAWLIARRSTDSSASSPFACCNSRMNRAKARAASPRTRACAACCSCRSLPIAGDFKDAAATLGHEHRAARGVGIRDACRAWRVPSDYRGGGVRAAAARPGRMGGIRPAVVGCPRRHRLVDRRSRARRLTAAARHHARRAPQLGLPRRGDPRVCVARAPQFRCPVALWPASGLIVSRLFSRPLDESAIARQSWRVTRMRNKCSANGRIFWSRRWRLPRRCSAR